MEKIITSIFLALLPLIATYLGRLNKDSLRKNMIDDAQKRIDFLKNYFQTISTLIPENEIQHLKVQLSNELNEIRNEVSSLDRKPLPGEPQKLGTVKSLFLTFKPLSALGLFWAILFYFLFIVLAFLFLGLFLDESSNFTFQALTKNLQDTDLMTGVVMLIVFLLIFRWLAISNYKSRSAKMVQVQPAV